jgi:exopolysaccharide biosynthesis polyprenyl glycosylphosphotransferase
MISRPEIDRNPSLRAAFEKFRLTQLRDGSLYTNLRTLVPVVVLAGVWVWINYYLEPRAFQPLIGRSVTVRHLLLAVGIVSLWNLWLSLSLYEQRSTEQDVLDELKRLLIAAFVCGTLPLLANLARGMYGRGLLLQEMITLGLLIASVSMLACFVLAARLSWSLRPRIALIIGTGKRASLLRERLQNHYTPFEIIGCVDDQYCGDDPEKDRYIGPIDHLEDLLKTHPIEVVLIGLPIKSMYTDIQKVIQICELVGVESHYMQDFFDTSYARVELHSQQPKQFAVLSTVRPDPKQHIKRIIDFVLALVLVVLVSPLLIVVALLVRLTSAGPVFFVQERYGLNRKRFPMFKFRSMTVDAEARQAGLEQRNEAAGPVFKLKADPRITPVGAFLRRTSIDELPQLFNVLRGEMSLVGPRPLPLRDVSRFQEPWLLRRFSVRPGLTCIWQINGRSTASFDLWVAQDLAYIDKWSLGLDLKILLMTIPAVVKGVGAV